MDAKPIASLQKNAREELRVDLTEYRGHRLLGLRIWADKSDGSGKVATPKGVTVKVAMLPAIRAALADAERQARDAGWLND